MILNSIVRPIAESRVILNGLTYLSKGQSNLNSVRYYAESVFIKLLPGFQLLNTLVTIGKISQTYQLIFCQFWFLTQAYITVLIITTR